MCSLHRGLSKVYALGAWATFVTVIVALTLIAKGADACRVMMAVLYAVETRGDAAEPYVEM